MSAFDDLLPASAGPQAPPPSPFDDLLPKAPERRSTPREILRQFGLTVRHGIEGATAIPNMVGDAFGLRSSEAVSGALDKLGLPRPEGRTERVVGDVARGMAAAGSSIGLGGTVAARAAGDVARNVGAEFARNAGTQIASAAAGSGAAGATREAGGGPGAQLAANVAASMAVPVAAGIVSRSRIPADQRALLETAAKNDVPLSYSDVTGTAKRIDTALEQLPVVGSGGFRARGAAKATEAANRVADQAREALEATPYRGLSRLQDAARNGDKAAVRVLEQVRNAGGDWQKVMQASGNLKLWRARQDASALYDRVEQLAAPRGNVEMTHTVSALDDAIARESQSKLPDATLLSTLTKIRQAVGESSDNGFTAIRQLRSDLGDIIANHYKGANALVGAKGVDKLQAVRNAVEQDMELFALGQGGDLARAWRRADIFYRTQVVPYKDQALAKALASDVPDEIYSRFVRIGRSGAGEDRAAKFYDALDERGRAAVRYGMVANALDAGMLPGRDTISPARFAKSLADIREASGVFFKNAEKAELAGFVNLMRHAERFGQFAENPPTGQRVVPWLVAGGIAVEPGTATAGLTTAYALRLMLTNPTLRDFLLAARNAKPDSALMQKISDDLARLLPRIAAQEMGQPSPEPRAPKRKPPANPRNAFTLEQGLK